MWWENIEYYTPIDSSEDNKEKKVSLESLAQLIKTHRNNRISENDPSYEIDNNNDAGIGLEYEKGEINEMGSDDLIYIPDVTVFKTDESIPQLKEEATWFNTDVIVCAAPVLAFHYDVKQYRQIMTSRVKRILDVAAKEKVEVLILGAFGCGAFCNPPEIVADVFASLIRNYNFGIVEFAVYCRSDTKNFDVFESKFL